MTEWNLTPKPVADSQVELAQVMNIADTNVAGIVHGGTIMKLVDTAAGLAAIKHSGGMCVTVSLDEMSFLAAVHVGENTLNDDALTSPTFFSVRFAVPESPGFFTVRLKSWSQAVFTFVFVLPPPVERQATPPCFVLLRTSVPCANTLPGLFVCALNVAKLATPRVAASTTTTAQVTRIFVRLLTGLPFSR